MAKGKGRKTKLTDEIVERICDLVKLRLSWNQIAAIVGIDPKTLRNWRDRGSQEGRTKRGDKIYREFVEQLNRAEAEMYAEAVEVFRKAMLGGEKTRSTKMVLENGIPVKTEITEKTLAPNWKAALEFLSRAQPELWGRYETLRLETDIRGEIESIGLDLEDVVAVLTKEIERLMASDGIEDEDPSKIVAVIEAQDDAEEP
jgi:transposase-like protein